MFVYARLPLNLSPLLPMQALDSILSFIAPHHCLGCQVEGTVCCQKCLDGLKLNSTDYACYSCQTKKNLREGICQSCRRESSLDGAFWFSDYKKDLAKSLVKALKFNNIHAASETMARGASSCLPLEVLASSDYICSVPTANKRVRQRGWDQAKLIATSLSHVQKVPRKSFLIRSSSFDQIGATKAERAEASKNFFQPIRKSLLRGETILLVDDVLTTGATLNSAARTLKSAGAKKVYAVTFARQGVEQFKK